MKRSEVPQHESSAYMGQSKALYATGDSGAYELIKSAGWEAEDIVLKQALEECERMTKESLDRVHSGESSPLEYHMYRQRMDLTLLSQSAGIFRWIVARHLKPVPFSRMSARYMSRYCDALSMTEQEMRKVPSKE